MAESVRETSSAVPRAVIKDPQELTTVVLASRAFLVTVLVLCKFVKMFARGLAFALLAYGPTSLIISGTVVGWSNTWNELYSTSLRSCFSLELFSLFCLFMTVFAIMVGAPWLIVDPPIRLWNRIAVTAYGPDTDMRIPLLFESSPWLKP